MPKPSDALTDKTVVTDEEFQSLIETAHGNGGLFEPKQADAWALLLYLITYAETAQRETYLQAAERLVMPYSHHFGDERARQSMFASLRGVERVEAKPRTKKR